MSTSHQNNLDDANKEKSNREGDKLAGKTLQLSRRLLRFLRKNHLNPGCPPRDEPTPTLALSLSHSGRLSQRLKLINNFMRFGIHKLKTMPSENSAPKICNYLRIKSV